LASNQSDGVMDGIDFAPFGCGDVPRLRRIRPHSGLKLIGTVRWVTSGPGSAERMSMGVTRSRTVRFHGAGGVTLVADEWDPGADVAGGRPTVVLLHGGGQNRFSWKNTCQVLADQGLHVVAPDSRGHGDSDRSPGGDYALDTLCADALAVVDQIGRPTVLIGASMGGLTGILAADAAGPQNVTGLVLVDVVPRFEKSGSARIRDFMFNHVHGFESLEEAADAVAAYLPHRIRPSSPDGLRKNLRHRNGRWYWHWDPAFLTKPGDDPFARVDKLEQAASRLTVPILLIRGKLSDVVSADGVRDFLRKVPHTEFVELSDAGHTAAGDDNDAFSHVVVEFVNR
jgi:pimeloyl-ACP methyl ester carboxylesterase